MQPLLDLLASGEEERFTEALRLLLDSAMLLERQKHLRAEPYQRTALRAGYANGFKSKRFQTRLGELALQVPQVRDAEEPFCPKSLERGLRSERAFKLALAEMYVQGVSTRKVAKITEELCGFEVSSAQVSRAAAELDGVLQAWRTRPLWETPYLILDARYEKVRQGGLVQDAAVLVAVGVGRDGKRSVLGVSVALSEHEVHWRTFLSSLVERGLCGVRLIVSDDHRGIAMACQAVFGSVPWQRCQFHLQRNAQAYVPRLDLRAQVASAIRYIFNAPDRPTAEMLLRQAVQRFQDEAPELAAWMEENLPEGLTVFSLPETQRRRLRTSNALERLNREIRRRTLVATLFPVLLHVCGWSRPC